jgi:PAS domain S-box-containing protein
MDPDSIEEFRTLVEHSTDIITLLDETGTVQYKSPSVEQELGYEQAALVGDSVFEYIHVEDQDRVQQAFSEVVESSGEATRSAEFRFRTAGGDWTWLESTVRSHPSSDIRGYVINSRDISERKEHERELAEERAKYETLVTRSHDGVAILQDGVVVFTNPRCREIVGYDANEALGLTIADVVAPGDVDLVRERLQDRLDTDADPPPARYEIELLTRSGDHLPVEISVSEIEYEGAPAVMVMLRDVSERNRNEERLEDLAARLEALNRVVRHDIRNDLNVMLGWAQLLEDHVDEEGTEYLEKILASGDHVVELTRIARDYVETLTDVDGADLTPVSLRAVLDTELTLRRESFPQAEFVVDGEIPRVEVQANEMLGAVFRNLLNNAVTHNDADAPRVTVRCEAGDDDVVVRVADNGPGIPDAQKEVVFGKGEKGIESPGTGIGLYLVRTLVDQYGGEIRVEDNEPRGAVFAVRLRRGGQGE